LKPDFFWRNPEKFFSPKILQAEFLSKKNNSKTLKGKKRIIPTKTFENFSKTIPKKKQEKKAEPTQL